MHTEFYENEKYEQAHCFDCERLKKQKENLICKYHRPAKNKKMSKQEIKELKKYLYGLYSKRNRNTLHS